MNQSLVTENQGLAHKIARGYNADADGHAAALLGLCVAADRFDPARGVKFSTYATWWIRCKVLKHIGRLASPEVSLDRAYDMDDGAGRTLHDVLPSTDPTPDVLTEDRHDQDQMIKTMVEFEQTLDPIDNPIDMVIWNWRIASEDPLTLDATAQKVSEIKPMTRQGVYLREVKIRARFEAFAKDRIE